MKALLGVSPGIASPPDVPPSGILAASANVSHIPQFVETNTGSSVASGIDSGLAGFGELQASPFMDGGVQDYMRAAAAGNGAGHDA